MTYSRGSRGNMLLLCFAVFGVVIAIAAVGFGVYFLFFTQKRLQGSCESFALEAAQQLNHNDFAGKLNNLHARSRELVYESRRLSNACENEDYKQFSPLAAQVMQRSREGAQLVDGERQKFASLSLRKLCDMTKAATEADKYKVEDLQVGYLKNQNSNVEIMEGPPELFQWDLENKYIERGRGMNLYRARVNLKLPHPDDDLSFELAPVSAPVRGTVAPLRLLDSGTFISTATLRAPAGDRPFTQKYSPSAVQVTLSSRVGDNSGGNLQTTARATNTAAANGAGPEIK